MKFPSTSLSNFFQFIIAKEKVNFESLENFMLSFGTGKIISSRSIPSLMTLP
jgi:hypothetical protein